ncbi:MAG: DNA-binding protein [Lautropia sp.]|nr:MAG: DNA-binding protein [Pseudomonadota bacterium]MBC6958780.1 DNA-binding protein [Lautropia sp.]MDL1907792.1 helix-turn-helix domain-containing protein [Betaproteobacteria bacterium PRO1]RIK89390.1 MAG: helix-turn-helix domain-containing protein [Burkholderiales bacterium]
MSTIFGIEVISLRELAVALDVTPRAVQKWVAAGRFPHPLAIGRNRVWRKDDVRVWLERKFAEAPSETLPRSRGA